MLDVDFLRRQVIMPGRSTSFWKSSFLLFDVVCSLFFTPHVLVLDIVAGRLPFMAST